MAVEHLQRGALLHPVRRSGPIDALMQAMTDSPYFEGIDQSILHQLASASIIHRYRKNQVLFVEGDVSRTLYFILSGRIKVYRLSRDGRERIVNMLGPGELMAAVPFFDGGGYPASAEVVDDAEIARLRWDDFQSIARDNPIVLFAMLKLMAKRVRQAQADIHGLALKSATARLARRLLELAEAYGEANDAGIEIDLKLNREELGALIGTSRETTTRVLRQFELERVICLDGCKVTIIKPFVLQSWSEA